MTQQDPTTDQTTEDVNPSVENADVQEADATDQQGTDSDRTPDQDDDDSTNPNKEAAKYRHRLRDTEAQRDQLQTRLDTLHREAIERHAAHHLAVPADLFDLGKHDLADLLDDDGNPDPTKIDTATNELLESRPGLAAGPATQNIVDAWKDSLGDDAHRKQDQIEALAKRLKDLGPFLNIEAFKGEDGQFSAERMEDFKSITHRMYLWPDTGGGRRGGGTAHGSGNGWKQLVEGDK